MSVEIADFLGLLPKKWISQCLIIVRGVASAIVVSILLIILPGCSGEKSSHNSPDTVEVTHSLEQTLEQHEQELMAIEGVLGVGIGRCNDQDCLIVLLENDTPELRDQIPDQVDGVTVDIKVSGPIETQPQ